MLKLGNAVKKILLVVNVILISIFIFYQESNDYLQGVSVSNNWIDGISVPENLASSDIKDVETINVGGTTNALLDRYYKVTTVAGMTKISDLTKNGVDFSTCRDGNYRVTFYLMNDLNYNEATSAKNYTPFVGTYNYDQIGAYNKNQASSKMFMGVFHGLSHTIYGLNGAAGAVDKSYGSGLFGVIYRAVISSLTLKGKGSTPTPTSYPTRANLTAQRAQSYINTFDIFGQRVNTATAVNNAPIDADSPFITNAYESIIYNCTNEINFYKNSQGGGGILGSGRATTIIGSVNKGYILSETYFSGGIAGQFDGNTSVTILNCVNYGTIDALENCAGGMAGSSYSVTIAKNCVNYGTIISGSTSESKGTQVRSGGIFSLIRYKNDGTTKSKMENVYTYYAGAYPEPYFNLANASSITSSSFNTYASHRDRFGQYAIGSYRLDVVGTLYTGTYIHTEQINGDQDLNGVLGYETSSSTFDSNKTSAFLAWKERLNHDISVAQEVGFQSGDVQTFYLSDVDYIGSDEFIDKLNSNVQALRVEFSTLSGYLNNWEVVSGRAVPQEASRATISHRANSVNTYFFDKQPVEVDKEIVTESDPTYYFLNSGSVLVSTPLARATVKYSYDDAPDVGFVNPSVLTFSDLGRHKVTIKTYEIEDLPEVGLTEVLKYEETFYVERIAEKLNINSRRDFYYFAISVNLGFNYLYKTVNLNVDLDLSLDGLDTSNNFIVIGNSESSKFSGTFNGNDHKITNLHTNRSTPTGLFGYIENATIKGLSVDGNMPGRGDDASGLFGLAKSSYIVDVYLNINVSGINNVSGFGKTTGNETFPTIFVNCVNKGTIIAQNSYAGGFSSQATYTYFYNSYNSGSIQALKNHAGGFVGYGDYIKIDNCINTGSISPTNRTSMSGGIVGEIQYRMSYNVINTITIGANLTAAGLLTTRITSGTSSYDYNASGASSFMVTRNNIFDSSTTIEATSLDDTHSKRLNDRTARFKSNTSLTGISSLVEEDICWFLRSASVIKFEASIYPTQFNTHPVTVVNYERPEINENINDNNIHDIYFKDFLYLKLYSMSTEYFSHFEYQLNGGELISLPKGETILELNDSYEVVSIFAVNQFGTLSSEINLKVTKTPDTPVKPEISSAVRYYYETDGTVLEKVYPTKEDITGEFKNKNYYALETYVYVDTLSTSLHTEIIRYEYATNINNPLWIPIVSSLPDGTPYITLITDKTHTIYIRSINSWGVYSDYSLINVVIDGAIPVAPIINKSYQTEWVIDSATLYFTAQSSNISVDGFHFEYRTIKYAGDDESPWVSLKDDTSGDYISTLVIDSHRDAPKVLEGTYYVQVRTVSRSGVPSKTTSELIKIDGAAPEIEIVSLNTNPGASNIVLKINANDGFGIGKLSYGWIKVYSEIDALSAVPNWNDELTYQVDENEAYYVAFAKDGLGRISSTYYQVLNYSASRPTSPVMKAQLVQISKTPNIEDSWVSFQGIGSDFEYRSSLPAFNTNALVDLINYGILSVLPPDDNRYYYRFVDIIDWTNGLVRVLISHGTINYETDDEISYTAYRINNNEYTHPYGNGEDFHFYIEGYSGIVRVYGATITNNGTSSSVTNDYSLIIQATIDTTPPTIPNYYVSYASLLKEGSYITPNEALIALQINEETGFGQGQASGVYLMEYKINSGSFTTYSMPFTVNTPGVNTIYFRQIDKAGNYSSIGSLTVTIDDIAPEFTYTTTGSEVSGSSDKYISSTSVDITINPTDNVLTNISKVEYSLDSDIWNNVAYANEAYKFTLVGNGTYHVYIRITDKAGNVSLDSALNSALEVIITDAIPVVNALFNPNWVSSYYKDTRISFSVSNDVKVSSFVLYNVFEVSEQEINLIETDFDNQYIDLELEEGTYRVVAKTTLETYNSTPYEFVIDKLDNVSPVIESINIDHGWSNTSKSATLNFLDEERTFMKYYVSLVEVQGEIDTSLFTSNISISSNNVYYIYAIDLALNVSSYFVHEEDHIDGIAPLIEIDDSGAGYISFWITDEGGSGIYGYTSTLTGVASQDKALYIPIPVGDPNNCYVTLAGVGTVYLWAIDVASNVSLAKSVIIGELLSGSTSASSATINSLTSSEVANYRDYEFNVSDGDGLLGYQILSYSTTLSSSSTGWKTADFYGNVVVGNTSIVFTDRITANSSSTTTYYLYICDLKQAVTKFTFSVLPIDSESPSVGSVLEVPDGELDYGSTSTVTISASDNSGIFQIYYGFDSNEINILYEGSITIPNDTYHILYIMVVDSALNTTYYNHTISYVDSTNPILSVSIEDENIWTNTSKNVFIDIDDLHLSHYIITGGIESGPTDSTTSGRIDLGAFESGNYTITIYDLAGNSTSRSFEVKKIDLTSPEFTLEYDSTEARSFILTVNVTNPVSLETYYYKLGESLTYSTTNTFNITLNDTYYIYVKNEAGTEIYEVVNITNIDNVAPVVVSATVLDATVWTNSNKSVFVTIRDDHDAAIYYYVSSSSQVPEAGSINILYEDGANVNLGTGTYYIFAKDSVGNISSYKRVTVEKIENISPIITLNTRYFYNSQIYVLLNLSDDINGSGVSGYYISDSYTEFESLIVPGNYHELGKVSELLLSLSQGTYYIALSDHAGNISDIFQITVWPTLIEEFLEYFANIEQKSSFDITDESQLEALEEVNNKFNGLLTLAGMTVDYVILDLSLDTYNSYLDINNFLNSVTKLKEGDQIGSHIYQGANYYLDTLNTDDLKFLITSIYNNAISELRDASSLAGMTNIVHSALIEMTNIPKEYHISYVLNATPSDVTNPNEDISYYTTEQTFDFEDAIREGYVFLGWYTSSDFRNSISTIFVGTNGDLTLYAKWELRKYTVSYILDGGTNNTGNPLFYYITSPTITLLSPSKPGYSFEGWFSDPVLTVGVSSIPTASHADLVLYAKFILLPVPDEVTDLLVINNGNGTFTYTWGVPSNSGEVTVTGYEVCLSSSLDVWIFVSSTSYTRYGLSNENTYYFAVRAVTANAKGLIVYTEDEYTGAASSPDGLSFSDPIYYDTGVSFVMNVMYTNGSAIGNYFYYITTNDSYVVDRLDFTEIESGSNILLLDYETYFTSTGIYYIYFFVKNVGGTLESVGEGTITFNFTGKVVSYNVEVSDGYYNDLITDLVEINTISPVTLVISYEIKNLTDGFDEYSSETFIPGVYRVKISFEGGDDYLPFIDYSNEFRISKLQIDPSDIDYGSLVSEFNNSNIVPVITHNEFNDIFTLTFSTNGITYSDNLPFNAGSYYVKISLNSEAGELFSYTDEVKILTITKKDITSLISYPVIDTHYTYSNRFYLSQITLGTNDYGSFSWVNPTSVPTVNNVTGYYARFTLSGEASINYISTKANELVVIHVDKKLYVLEFSTMPSDIYVGDNLPTLRNYLITNTEVSGIFSYTNGNLVTQSTTYNFTWTPSDTENYEVVSSSINLAPKNVILESIIVTTRPYLDEYYAFEAVDLTGIVVKAIYNHGEDKIVSHLSLEIIYQNYAGYFSGTDKYFTVKYLNVYTVVYVTVNKIALELSPDYDHDTLIYTSTLITSIELFDLSDPDGVIRFNSAPLTEGNKLYGWTYTPYNQDDYLVVTGSTYINVLDVVATSLEVNETLSDYLKDYHALDLFIKTNLYLELVYNDLSTGLVPISLVEISYIGGALSIQGNHSYVIASFGGLTVDVLINAPTLLVPSASNYTHDVYVSYSTGLTLLDIKDILPSGYVFDNENALVTRGLNSEISAHYLPDDSINYISKSVKVSFVAKQEIGEDDYTYLNQNSSIYTGSNLNAIFENSLGIEFVVLYSLVEGNYTNTLPLNASIYYIKVSLSDEYKDEFEFSDLFTTFQVLKKEVDDLIETPVISTTFEYSSLRLLGNISIPSNSYGTYSWVDGFVNPTVSDEYYEAIFILNDSLNYSYTSGNVSIRINIIKKLYVFSFSGFDELYEGDLLPILQNHLVSIPEVSGEFSFVDQTLVQVGTQNYNYLWTPSDTSNYSIVHGSISLKGEQKILNSIYIEKAPDKISYLAKEVVSLNGIIVKARFNHGEDIIISVGSLAVSYQNGGNSFSGIDNYFTLSYASNFVTRSVNVNVVVSKIILEFEVTYSGAPIYSSTPGQDVNLVRSDNSIPGVLRLSSNILSSSVSEYEYIFTPNLNYINDYAVVRGNITLTVLEVLPVLIRIGDSSNYLDTYQSFDLFNKIGLVINVLYNDSSSQDISLSLVYIEYQTSHGYITGNDSYVIANYLGNTVNVPITVNKLTPSVSNLNIGNVKFEDNLYLSSVELPEDYAWENGNVLLTLGNKEYNAI
ncbi:MAG: InlB B-repeat-containing protein, partial [Acholeplasmatales bacterium]|nr:InlB B-repeat-containing protein [Acholeplasmatales bacterium]